MKKLLLLCVILVGCSPQIIESSIVNGYETKCVLPFGVYRVAFEEIEKQSITHRVHVWRMGGHELYIDSVSFLVDGKVYKLTDGKVSFGHAYFPIDKSFVKAVADSKFTVIALDGWEDTDPLQFTGNHYDAMVNYNILIGN